MNAQISNIFIVLVLSVAVMSCKTSNQHRAYFKDLDAQATGILETLPYTAAIEPESELTINVMSEVPAATAEFNRPYVNPATPGTKELGTQPQMQTYIVDDKGFIDFPKLGEIHVAGMTTYQLKDYLTKRISEYVNNPTVTVTMSGYRVVVMGEVKSPQVIQTDADRFSILDALAEAGDLTDYALRDNVLVLRRGQNGQIEYAHINLQSSDITKNPCFWLKNNDVVLVSPNNIKEDNSRYNQNNAYKLSVISTIVGMSSAISSLVIALAVR